MIRNKVIEYSVAILILRLKSIPIRDPRYYLKLCILQFPGGKVSKILACLILKIIRGKKV